MTRVRIAARLLAVQGLAECLAGIVYCALAAIGALTGSLPGDTPRHRVSSMSWLMVAAGLGMLVLGSLKVFTGIRNSALRNRGLGYIAFLSALPTAMTVHCAPTGLAIMVYGLIVYSLPAGRAAFRGGVSNQAEANAAEQSPA